MSSSAVSAAGPTEVSEFLARLPEMISPVAAGRYASHSLTKFSCRWVVPVQLTGIKGFKKKLRRAFVAAMVEAARGPLAKADFLLAQSEGVNPTSVPLASNFTKDGNSADGVKSGLRRRFALSDLTTKPVYVVGSENEIIPPQFSLDTGSRRTRREAGFSGGRLSMGYSTPLVSVLFTTDVLGVVTVECVLDLGPVAKSMSNLESMSLEEEFLGDLRGLVMPMYYTGHSLVDYLNRSPFLNGSASFERADRIRDVIRCAADLNGYLTFLSSESEKENGGGNILADTWGSDEFLFVRDFLVAWQKGVTEAMG